MVDSDLLEIVVTRLDVGPRAVSAAAALLSAAERERASRFSFERDRRRFMVGRALLRRLLGARLDVRAESVDLMFGARGKPALAPPLAGSGLRFNVSHCEDVAVYALARQREIGIDIEALREIPDADAIAEHMFSRYENDAYRALEPCERPVGFFNCWTRKEAYVKALGDGLHHPLDSFDVTLGPGEPARILRVEDTAGSDCHWTLHSFAHGGGLLPFQFDGGEPPAASGGAAAGDGRAPDLAAIVGTSLVGAVVVETVARQAAATAPPERLVVRPLPADCEDHECPQCSLSLRMS